MNCKILITEAAKRDIADAASYILFSLKNPRAANSLLDAADAVINSLSRMPERYSLVHDKVLSSWGIRCVQVKNYLVFYTVSTETAAVHIIRFLYKKRDWISILHSSYRPEA